jgi:hypothetical protein
MVPIPPFKTAIAALLAAGTEVAHADGIEFGETKTRFEIQRTLDAKTTLDARTMLHPWYVDWRHTLTWQHGIAKPRPYFAPPGCFIVRRVTTSNDVALQSIYICR